MGKFPLILSSHFLRLRERTVREKGSEKARGRMGEKHSVTLGDGTHLLGFRSSRDASLVSAHFCEDLRAEWNTGTNRGLKRKTDKETEYECTMPSTSWLWYLSLCLCHSLTLAALSRSLAACISVSRAVVVSVSLSVFLYLSLCLLLSHLNTLHTHTGSP